ncbi:carbon-nitrogen hydrolase family protein [Actinoplanes sp. CA-030573]|uniref:carbon-nitrogen hydrolase family protein n=1 Tax=Actinoplanes sp. CA-030573 TaxID=3239898 RepID=UPI003D8F99F3
MTIFVAQHARRDSAEATVAAVLDDLDGWVTDDASFVVLPENVFAATDVDRAPFAPALREQCRDRLAALARRHGTYVLTGSWVEDRPGAGPAQVVRLLDPDGAVCAQVERPVLANGTTGAGTDFPVVETPFGHVGVLLGPDFWLVEPPRVECLAGAELLLVAGALDGVQQAAQRSAVWGIATLNTVAVAFASALSESSGGGSAVAMPEGFVAEAGTAEGVIEAPWDVAKVRHLREPDLRFQQTLWFGLWARRTELYADLTAQVG